MITRTSFLLTLAAATCSLAFAKPNFSGEWKVDVSKSDFGDMPAPNGIVMEIVHSDPKLVMKQFQSGGPLGEMKADLSYMTDGTETRNNVRGNEVASTGKWSGDSLKIATKMSWQGNSMNIIETWKLTGGGKSLEILREIFSDQGNSTMKLVFNKSDKK